MGDGYAVTPEVLRSVARSLRSRGDANGSAVTGIGASVDAGRSTGEVASAIGWLTEELATANESLSALAAKLDGAADRYETTDADSAGRYGDARGVAPAPVPEAAQ